MAHLDQGENLILFSTGSSTPYRIELRTLNEVVEIEYPPPLRGERIKVLGSCRGLLCISKADNRRVAIWNPSNGSHRLLPSSDTEICGVVVPSTCVHGFGYDDTNNDYVLLRLVQAVEEPIQSEVSIYSLRDNVWRPLKEVWRPLEEMQYYLVNRHKRGVFAHGRLLWIMTPKLVPDLPKVLVAFNIHTKGFEVVRRLDFVDNTFDMDLVVLGERLCLIIYRDQGGVQVWIMREGGLNEPWDVLFPIPDYQTDWGLVRPLAYSLDGRRVLVGVGCKNLVWYDVQTTNVRSFDNLRGMPNSFEAEICLQTDVAVD